MAQTPPVPTLEEIASGGKAALARALALLEQRPRDADVIDLLDNAYKAPRGHVIGVTGPPGVGKSTLCGALIAAWRKRGLTVGVLAVDPSSKRSGGALLGDRVRISTATEDQGVFVRSMAARDKLGGLARETISAMVLMRAIYDCVLVETVGVGQSETDVAHAADTVIFCVQPGSGDTLQFMKAGIAEIPDIVAVTKADLGAAANKAKHDVEAALKLSGAARPDWSVPILLVSSAARRGIEDLVDRIAAHAALPGRAARRLEQAASWLEESVRDRFGRDGVERAEASLALPEGVSPFRREAEIADLLRGAKRLR